MGLWIRNFFCGFHRLDHRALEWVSRKMSHIKLRRLPLKLLQFTLLLPIVTFFGISSNLLSTTPCVWKKRVLHRFNRILTADHSCTNDSKKIFIEVCSPHLYASFGTFWVQIVQLFEAEWVFEVCLKIDKSLLSKENVVDFGILPNV